MDSIHLRIWFDLSWYKYGELVLLLNRLSVGFNFTDVIPFIFHLDTLHCQVVAIQREPFVLPDYDLTSADYSVVFLPDECACSDIFHLRRSLDS